MHRRSLLVLLASAAALLLAATAADAKLVHTTVVRTVDLSSQGSRIVREAATAAIRNLDDTPEDTYTVEIPRDRAPRLTHLAVTHEVLGGGSEKKGGEVLKLVSKSMTGGATTHFTFALPAPLGKGDAAIVRIDSAFLDDTAPLPRALAQGDRQRLLFDGQLALASPYDTETLKVEVRLPTSAAPESYSQTVSPVTLRGSTITYGPLPGSSAANHPLRVHFDAPKVGLVARSWRRDVWVRNFGSSLEVEEHVHLAHNGASLKGHFSRLDHMQAYATQLHKINAVMSLPVPLPKSASEVYFRDEIGNVSTSRLASQGNRKVLEIQPRYPLVGGWVYNWFHGYAVDGAAFLAQVGASQYRLTVPLVDGIPGVAIDDLHVKLVLPEGAAEISVEHTSPNAAGTPLAIDTSGVTYYYLDTTGRPTVHLRARTVLPEHWTNVAVMYSLSPLRKLQKPLAVASVVVLLTFLIRVLGSLDCTLVRRDTPLRRLAELHSSRARILARVRTARAAVSQDDEASVAALAGTLSSANAELKTNAAALGMHRQRVDELAREPGTVIGAKVVRAVAEMVDADLEWADGEIELAKMVLTNDGTDAERARFSDVLRRVNAVAKVAGAAAEVVRKAAGTV
ncbi:dolichyl-diphosphooligosaccharide--protein glycosyltransferase subunit 1 [Blastocladiella emersonii ATCC 22665]|nr:dolichyl-diphosphooligosaccharide--protein glycosyltransferase subunit 1 [Blastocladiella emersonii ATCC 22665]